MKKLSKTWILAVVPLLIIVVWAISQKITIKKLVNENCSQFEIGEDWISCITDLSLEMNDAKYCRTESVFSPYPGLCMAGFAQNTQDQESCRTISKPKYEEECLSRFK